jgi:hypothetical protein
MDTAEATSSKRPQDIEVTQRVLAFRDAHHGIGILVTRLTGLLLWLLLLYLVLVPFLVLLLLRLLMRLRLLWLLLLVLLLRLLVVRRLLLLWRLWHSLLLLLLEDCRISSRADGLWSVIIYRSG